MPTEDANRREDEVIDLVVRSLCDHGRRTLVVDRPDRRQSQKPGGLTVDVILEIDGEKWAMDVMALTWRRDRNPAVDKLAARLTKEFGSKLIAINKTMFLIAHVSLDQAVQDSLVELVRSALDSGKNLRCRDESVEFYPWQFRLGPVCVQPWLQTSFRVSEEIFNSAGPSIAKKLRGQALRARELGFRAMLAMDQRGSRDLKYGANYMAHPQTIRIALERTESDVEQNFDSVAVVQANDTVNWIRK